jgi:hypothetical protein
VNLIFPQHGMRHTLKEKDSPRSFQAELNHTRPDAPVNEAVHASAHILFGNAAFVGDEVRERKTDDLLERLPDEIRKTTVGGADFTLQAEGQKNIVKGVNQVAKALLRFRDHLEELLELTVAGGLGVFLVQSAHQPL